MNLSSSHVTKMQPKSRTTCQIWITSVKTCCSRENSMSKPYGWICPKTNEFLDQFCTQNLSCWPQRMLSSPPLVTGMLQNETWNKQMHLSFMSTCIKFGIVIKLFPQFFQNSTLSAWWFCCFRLLNIEVYAGCGCVSSWWSCGRARGTRCQKPRPPKCMVTDWSKIFHLVDIPKNNQTPTFISQNQLEIHQLDLTVFHD